MNAAVLDSEAEERLAEHWHIWQRKPILQKIYREEFFSRLLSFRQPGGISVEVGGGPGFLKNMSPDLISTDITWCPWLDAVTDAQSLSFKSSSVTNVMGLDILHHLQKPMAFLEEAQRILVPGGRLILIETWVTPFSYLIYRFFHQEDCDLSRDPRGDHAIRTEKEKKAFEGNQAIPYLLFGSRNSKTTLGLLPHLKVLKIEPFCLFAYLLSLGFKSSCLLPEVLYPLVSAVERITLPLWRSFAALRALIVLEKKFEV